MKASLSDQQVALTSEACLKGLPKTAAGEVVAFKGWPKLHWFVTEHLGKTPKEWMPPTRLTDDTPAYIEYTTDKDGSVMGVTITRAAMLAHCRALTQVTGCGRLTFVLSFFTRWVHGTTGPRPLYF